MPAGIVAPLAIECRTARPLRRAGWLVRHSGVGSGRAVAAAEALVAAGADRLLVWGTAGGLNPALKPGVLTLPRHVSNAAGERFTLDTIWRQELRDSLPSELTVNDGDMVTVTSPVATMADKAALARSSGACTVDMEAAAVAEFAADQGIPCAVLRAVADPFRLALPGVVLAARGDHLLPLEIPLRLVFRPGEVRSMHALGKAFGAARASLDSAARSIAAGG